MRDERHEYRLSLSNVDRDVTLEKTVVVGRHPSETVQHLVLRMLAFCLVYEERIVFGPGVCVGDAADLSADDLTGKLALWVRCGNADPEIVRKVVQHNREARVHLVFGGAEARDEFVSTVAKWQRTPRGWENVTLWTAPPDLIDALAALPSPRQRWSVTIVGDHAYVESDGVAHDGAIDHGPAPLSP